MRILWSVVFLLASLAAGAKPLTPAEVPEPLRPWVGWVLHGEEARFCPFAYGDGADRRCAWPGTLHLELDGEGGRFRQSWLILAESGVILPGDARRWPQGVLVNGAPAPVTERDGRPVLRLPPGYHELSGQLVWERLPEALALPPRVALVSLELDGSPVEAPDLDRDGRLWLRPRTPAAAATAADALELRVARRYVDEIPARVRTRIELDVAGQAREELLGVALLPGAIPLALEAPLPARLEPDGRLRVQVRPGTWVVELTARLPGPVTEVGPPAGETPLAPEEVWVFEARPHLREVAVTGAPAIDPRQVSLPADWRELPAYRLVPGEAWQLLEKRRGDPEPEPDRIALERQLWLDFAGGGFTFQDRLSGTVTRTWRLEAAPPLVPGRVVVDGEDQLITRLEGTEGAGVEVRRGRLQMLAEGRIETPPGAPLPALGWRHDVHGLATSLHLPPGWRLFMASGPDRVEHTWWSRWTLFDLFLVLVIAAAVGKLWGWGWAALALAAVALAYHEPGAPRQAWLHVLAAVALLRVLPAGRLRLAAQWYRGLALAALVVILLPFLVFQIRAALFPVLEQPWQALADSSVFRPRVAAVPDQVDALEAPAAPEAYERSEVLRKLEQVRPSVPAAAGVPAPPPRLDPEARVQTGPGLPDWSWRTVRLQWSGPVAADQELRFHFLEPVHMLGLRLLGVALLLVLAWRLLDLRRGPRPVAPADEPPFGSEVPSTPGATPRSGPISAPRTGPTPAPASRAGLALVLALGLALGAGPREARAELPDPALLEQLKARLLAPADCLPRCAEIPRLHLEVEGTRLQARLEIHSLADVAVPLPGLHGQWLPEALWVNEQPALALAREADGKLWLHLPPGRHDVRLQGTLPARTEVSLALPLRPRQVQAAVSGWELAGLGRDGVPEGDLQLSRVVASPEGAPAEILEPGTLPAFLRVERTLRLGLDWQVETRVVRVSPPGTAVAVEVPLLAGESVTSAQPRVVDGRARVHLGAGETTAAWISILAVRETLVLVAPDTHAWSEVWRVDPSPLWHLEWEGIPVVHRQAADRWLPEWRPWPGERVQLQVTRPPAVAGRTLTIDSSDLVLRPGQRAAEVELSLNLRSSQGGEHTLLLPAAATLQSVLLDGVPQPVRQDGRAVTLPLVPGSRQAVLNWREPAASGSRLTTPQVSLGTESVNARLQVDLPPNRWVLLTGGPRLGPAVLFWGLLLVVVLAAVALGRGRQTPLRTHEWALLGVGLTQIPVVAALVPVAWLFALAARRRFAGLLRPWVFNSVQMLLPLLTLAAASILFWAVQQGLLGSPEMQVAGNGSSGSRLLWYQDRSGPELPQAWVLSAPLLAYRLLMLAWALWLAFALLRWLRWGWECFVADGIWRGYRLAPGPQPAGRSDAAGPDPGPSTTASR